MHKTRLELPKACLYAYKEMQSAGRQHTPKREVACILGVAASAAARASSASALVTVTSCTM